MSSLVNFSGIASGIDSSSLIKALLDQERAVRITPLKDKITHLTDTNNAFGDLKGLLSKLQTAASKFRVVNGTALSKTAISSDESAISATASSSASNGTYSITVNSIARNGVFTQNDSFSSLDSVVNASINDGTSDAARTLTFSIGTGSEQETINIVLSSTTKLSDIVTNFNSTSTKAVMSAVNTGTTTTPDYQLVVTSLNEGTEKGAIAASRGAELTTVGIFDPLAATQQAAANANLDVAGVGTGILRGSNSIADLIPGVTLNLEDTGSAEISVSDDRAVTANKMQDFVDAYNQIIKYVSENDLITQEKDGNDVKNIFGTLSSTSLDENLLSSLRGSLTSSSISGHTANTLADLGISTNRDGTISFNSATFEEAIANDSEAVRSITSNLGETLASTTGVIAQFNRFNGLIDTAFNSNTNQISNFNSQIGTFEAQLSKREESLIKQYARLESMIGQLNSQQSSLSSILKGAA